MRSLPKHPRLPKPVGTAEFRSPAQFEQAVEHQPHLAVGSVRLNHRVLVIVVQPETEEFARLE